MRVLRPNPQFAQPRIEVIRRLARGGMGEVFLVRRWTLPGVSKLFALKRLIPTPGEPDPYFETMFRDEARVALALDHPNVCQVFDVDHADGYTYMLMEYIDGPSLKTFSRMAIKGGHRFDLRFLGGLLVQATEALHYCHTACDDGGAPLDLVHRDITPGNLQLTRTGHLKLLDFGVAKAANTESRTRTGIIKGKPAYLAPELLREQPASPRSDIFSLAAVFWELATGCWLFRRDDIRDTLQAIHKHPAPRLDKVRGDVPPALADAISRALSKHPANRFAGARELGAAVTAALSGCGGPMGPAEIAATINVLENGPETRAWTPGPALPRRRNRVAVILATALFTTLLATATGALVGLL